MPVGTTLLGELIIISLEMFLSYARRVLMTTKPKKAHCTKEIFSIPDSVSKVPPVIYVEKEWVGQVKNLSDQLLRMKLE